MRKVLVNFLTDENLLHSFTAISKSLGYTRTSLLVGFMQDFCVENVAELEKQNRKIEQLNHALTQQHLLQAEASHQRLMAKPLDPNDGPISFFYDDGGETYGDNNF